MLEPEDTGDQDTLVGTAMEQFEISQKIGEGSIGTIYKAFDLINQRDVAIKFLTREVGSSPQILDRFKREIQITIKMAHQNIVRGFTAGLWEGCIYYYVMEYIDGSTLHDLMSRERMTEELAVEIMYQMVQALKYINEFGMIHRDVKPENIMITRTGVAKLADLGLAKAKDDMSGVTMVGTIIGTPLYMSPEQAKGSNVIDIRTDIYSLGATMYHAVTGEPPFKGQSAPVVIAKQINEIPRPVRELNPSLSPGFEYIIAKSMEKDPSRRYQKPQDLLADLILLKEGKGSCTDTFVPWGLVAAKAREKEFRFAYFPNDSDFEFALTAVANKLVEQEALAGILDFQEELAQHGMPVKLAYLSVENGLLNQAQADKIRSAQKRQRIKERGSEFGELAVKARFVSEGQVQEALDIQNGSRSRGEDDRLLGSILKDLGRLDDRKIDIILSQQESIKHGREDRHFLKLALKMNLVSKPFVEKARTIQQNEVAMGRYREIGTILIERKYISPKARDVIMRALRRHHLTGEVVDDLISEKEEDVKRATATIHIEAGRLKKYTKMVETLVLQGRRRYKARDFRGALQTWQEVFDILASHPETEKLIERTQDIVGNIAGHLAQAGNFVKLAMREWKAVLKIKGDYPDALEGMTWARNQIVTLLSNTAEPDEDDADRTRGEPIEVADTKSSEPAAQTQAQMQEEEEEVAEPSEEDRTQAKAARALKHAKRFYRERRNRRAREKLVEALTHDPQCVEANDMMRIIDRRERRVAVVCFLLIAVVLGGSLAGGVLAYGTQESTNLLFQVLGDLADFISP
jgi:serine/threonine-protein kinase